MRTLWLLALLALPALAERLDLMVPMRDSVRLHTLVDTPDGQGPWPVILTRTPYDMTRGEEPRQFTARGYVRVNQNCRGQFKSEGKYRAFADDMEDGYDAIEWIAKQPWSNGKVGMAGGSAPGITTNLAAMSGAPHLAAAYVTVATGSGYRHSQFPGGVFLQYMNEEWLKGRGVQPSEEPRPLHRFYDAEARRLDMRHYYSKIKVPFVNIGGWYDIFSQGNIENFVGLQAQGAGDARGHQKLLMGAFGHGKLSGEIQFPETAFDRRPAGMFRWFDYWLKGVDTGILKEPSVRYYVMGDPTDGNAPGNEWRTADGWPPKAEIKSYYLLEGSRLVSKPPAGSGPAGSGKDTYAYDPRNPVPTMGGNNLQLPKGPLDQRKVSGRPDVLKYETEPLENAIEIAGQVFAELYVSTDAEDTDFMVKLVDVYPNGYQALVLDQAFRLRYHESFEKPARIVKNRVYKIKVDLWSTALVFNRGHKIAMHVSSSNAPRFEPHSNTWAPVKSYGEAVVAHNTVHHASGQPSRLLLPVTKVYGGERSAAGAARAGR